MSAIDGLSAATAPAAQSNALSGLSGDFNMFLKLLTTQMQNQDPLDPMDTSEYTQQLVQYSQVEQSIQQTATLKDILARLTTQDVAQASAFIGREVQIDSAVAGLGDDPAQWGWQASRPVASLVATITDSSGRTVDTRTIEGGSEGRFVWDGQLANGTTAPAGSYTLSLKAVDAAGTSVPVSVSSIGMVKSVTAADGAIQLGVNGVTLPVEQLLRVALAQ